MSESDPLRVLIADDEPLAAERLQLLLARAVVFVTAFDQFAVAAFEVEAVDYLMKPVDPNRLQRALDRTRAYLEQRSAQPSPGKSSQWLEEFWASDLSGLIRNCL